jgi:flagellar hook protein FlgE
MSSFAIPLSGLNAAQSQLNAVSNNLANMNTVGFKDQTVNFSDLFANAYAIHTNGSGDPLQTGLGVKVSSIDSDFTEGSLTETGTQSNMALSGQGFFVTKDAQGSLDYTRAGDFTTNKAGQLTTPEGNLVMGYPATGGVVNTSGALQPILVGAQTTPAVATQNFSITANLSSNAAVGDSATPTNFSVYDSLGQAHTVSVSYTKTGTNSWSYNVSMPTADFTNGATGNTTLATGTLNFDSSGKLDTSAGKSIAISTPAGSSFTDGAASLSANWNLVDSNGNATLTQTATASGTSATNQDGYASGTLTGYTISADGTIEGSFTSGKTLALGQVAVANFANVEGLTNIGGNSYQVSPASGDAVIGVAETGGRGSVIGGSVEESNVDISTEFSKLIVAQQAYSANAKSITAFNQVSQATIAMIQ